MRKHVDDELAWQRIRAAEPRTEVVRVWGAKSTSDDLREKLGAYFAAQHKKDGGEK